MSCEFCEKADFGSFSVSADKYSANIYLAGGSGRFEKDKQFKFCPECGKSLKQLKRMDVNPVHCDLRNCSQMTSPIGMLSINSVGIRKAIDEIGKLTLENEMLKDEIEIYKLALKQKDSYIATLEKENEYTRGRDAR